MDFSIFENNLNKDWVFSIDHLIESARKCSKNVGWKSSVISYNTRLTKNILKTKEEIDKNEYHLCNKFNEFIVNERGKVRNIRAPRYSERIVQKCLCDYCLVPILSRSLINNNGACLQGKGVMFSRTRFRRDLNRLLQSNTKGEKFILFIDFKKYFDNIDHNILKTELKKYIRDNYLFNLTCEHIDSFGIIGLGLGSQVSQILSVFYCNKLDHFITNYLHIKYYGRYMDDSYIMCDSKDKIEYYKSEIEKFCINKLHVKFSNNKVKIQKINNTSNKITRLKYIKCTFLVKNNKIIKTFGGKDSSIREKRKLKAMKKKLINNEIDISYIESFYKGWRYSIVSQFENIRYVVFMDKFYISEFGLESFIRSVKVKKYYKNDYLNKNNRLNRFIDQEEPAPQAPVHAKHVPIQVTP